MHTYVVSRMPTSPAAMAEVIMICAPSWPCSVTFKVRRSFTRCPEIHSLRACEVGSLYNLAGISSNVLRKRRPLLILGSRSRVRSKLRIQPGPSASIKRYTDEEEVPVSYFVQTKTGDGAQSIPRFKVRDCTLCIAHADRT